VKGRRACTAIGLTNLRNSRVPFGTLRLKWCSRKRRSPQKKKIIPQLKSSRARDRESRLPGGKRPSRELGNGPIITLRGDESDPPYIVRCLDRNTLRQKGISIRASLRWIDTFKTPNGGLGVPFIDHLGRFTGHLAYKWSCDPRSIISTTVATIANRLLSYCRRHNKNHVVKRFSKTLLGAAAYYAFTKNSHFWDRVLYFSRNLERRGTLIHRLRLFFSSKWDDNKRFVYGQVIYQTDWLLFRAYGPRDKSHFFSKRIKRTIWREPEDAPSRLMVTSCVREIAYAISQM